MATSRKPKAEFSQARIVLTDGKVVNKTKFDMAEAEAKRLLSVAQGIRATESEYAQLRDMILADQELESGETIYGSWKPYYLSSGGGGGGGGGGGAAGGFSSNSYGGTAGGGGGSNMNSGGFSYKAVRSQDATAHWLTHGVNIGLEWPVAVTRPNVYDRAMVWVLPMLSSDTCGQVSGPWFTVAGQVAADVAVWTGRLSPEDRKAIGLDETDSRSYRGPLALEAVARCCINKAALDVVPMLKEDMAEVGIRIGEGETYPDEWESEFAWRVYELSQAHYHHFCLCVSSAARSRVSRGESENGWCGSLMDRIV